MMPHYRGMNRGLCSVSGSFGYGTGNVAVLLRFKPESGSATPLRNWLLQDALPQFPSNRDRQCHLLEGAVAPQMTNEQRIRGADAGVDWALLLTGYSEDEGELTELAGRARAFVPGAVLGAAEIAEAMYRFDYSVSCGEIGA